MSVSPFLHETKCMVGDVETVAWRPAPYVELGPWARLGDTWSPRPAPGHAQPPDTRDVTGFYSDLGPEQDWVNILQTNR